MLLSTALVPYIASAVWRVCIVPYYSGAKLLKSARVSRAHSSCHLSASAAEQFHLQPVTAALVLPGDLQLHAASGGVGPTAGR